MTNTVLLKQVLAVPTQSGQEDQLIMFLLRHFQGKGFRFHVDQKLNIYVTKGHIVEGEAYPCFAAHTDSVHPVQPVTIVRAGDKLTAQDSQGQPCGLGGDDKAGVFICLEMLEKFPVCKAVFFVEEEIGYRGSQASDPKWFEDVGYFIEFDSPCATIMTYRCCGLQLFPDDGPFSEALVPRAKKYGMTRWQNHPYTDVLPIKERSDFPCLNLPAGYYKMHSSEEYVLITAVANTISMTIDLVRALGHKRYVFPNDARRKSRPAFEVTALDCSGW